MHGSVIKTPIEINKGLVLNTPIFIKVLKENPEIMKIIKYVILFHMKLKSNGSYPEQSNIIKINIPNTIYIDPIIPIKNCMAS